MPQLFSRIRTVSAVLAAATLLLSSTGAPRLAPAATSPFATDTGQHPRPDPTLEPDEVVRIQLRALQTNDEARGDSGIMLAFEFASPSNREVVGPLTHFIAMVKTPAYRPMLAHRSAEQGPLVVSGNRAQQRVTVTTAAGRSVVFLFTLSRQATGEFAGCWMTDAVIREEDEEPPPVDYGIRLT